MCATIIVNRDEMPAGRREALAWLELDDEHDATLYVQMFGSARILIGRKDRAWAEQDHFFERLPEAFAALEQLEKGEAPTWPTRS